MSKEKKEEDFKFCADQNTKRVPRLSGQEFLDEGGTADGQKRENGRMTHEVGVPTTENASGTMQTQVSMDYHC